MSKVTRDEVELSKESIVDIIAPINAANIIPRKPVGTSVLMRKG